MLLDIAKLPTAENSAIRLHPSDNVAIARVPVAPGTELRIGGVRVTADDAIPAGHKIALRDIAAGEMVLRYGQTIGRARVPIAPGHHIHTHNLAFEELHFDYEFPSAEAPAAPRPAACPTFLGYLREDGRAGTRNYIAVVAASNCAAHTAETIARSYAGKCCRKASMAWLPFPTAKAAATPWGRMSISSAAPWAACWCIPTFRRR